MDKNCDNNKTLPTTTALERYYMTTDMDVNRTLDIMEAIPDNYVKFNGRTFWLDESQATLLRNLGVSFSKYPIRKWIPEDEWD